MSSFIVLSAKGEVKNSVLGDLKDGIETSLGKIFKRAKAPVLIGSWPWQKYKLFLYGYKEGRANTENKHELLSPFDETVLFGDACIIASLEKSPEKPVSFTSEMYKKFYNAKPAADDDSEDEDDEEEADLDDDDDDDEEDIEYDEEGADEDGIVDNDLMDEDEEEEIRPMLRIKPSSGFKKIAKWMYMPELVSEEYVL